ncbi:tetratricopeptide repeat protein [Nonomuraea fuscirosea]|jgi:tetratricopeptide (TPR) repeat protein|uniref:tetratricopeptide repeat protein n=1 Tax=Nonomuraea fuscirosea TaxID=1291556 RepID=UPI002DDBB486|nr:tetratricopeptide repeat protein [Nonomuraea fuscirosea]WSA52544.1 tetratricopeptide repeat protein [Nonomuraea fuscirosea]
MDGPIERAKLSYERAVFAGEVGGLAAAERELDKVEADLALARGRILHARFFDDRREDPRELELFERATRLYRTLGEAAGEAESVFWEGCFHQVVRGDHDRAVPLLEQAYELATAAGDPYTRSEALRHLGIADHAAGRLDSARERLEAAAQQRREIGLPAGAAADQVGLIYIAAAQGRWDDAVALATEAYATAEACGAHRIMRQVAEARDHVMAQKVDHGETRDQRAP